MKKASIVLYAVVAAVFLLGAIYFYVVQNPAAGVMGTLACTLSLVALILHRKAQ